MKKIAAFLCALCLLLIASPAASAQQGLGGGAGAVGQVDPNDSGPTNDVNLIFAKLQLELAEQSKNSAMESMQGIQTTQSQQKETAEYLNQARELQAKAAEAEKNGETATELPEDLKTYMDENGITYDGNLESAVQGLQAHQEQQGTDIQQQMADVQNFMSQYNGYTQGANNSIASGTQTLTSVARGQSLFSTTGATATALPPIAASLLAGVLLGMAIMWGIRRKRPQGTEK